MLSRPGALPDFNFLMAASSSSTVQSDDMLASAVAALESEGDFTRRPACEVCVCIWEASVIDMPPGTDCPYPIRLLAFLGMIRPYHVMIRI